MSPMWPPASAPSATTHSAPHFSYMAARRPEETMPANGVPASRHQRMMSREMPAPWTMKETPSSSAVRADSSKSDLLMAAMRLMPTKPPGATALARWISARRCSGVLTTPEMVPTPTKRRERTAATLPARPSEAWTPMPPWTSSRFPDATMARMVVRSSLGASTRDVEGREASRFSTDIDMDAPGRARSER